MSRDLNLIQLIGRVGSQPELRYTTAGTAVATISLATNRQWTDGAGVAHDEPQWHRVIVWSKAAEILARSVQVGSRLYVSGRVEYRKFQDRESGADRYSTDIILDQFIFLDGRAREVNGNGVEHAEAVPPF